MINLFALLGKLGSEGIRHVPLGQDVQHEIDHRLKEQAVELRGADSIPYSPDFRPRDHEGVSQYIDDFELPEIMATASERIDTIDDLTQHEIGQNRVTGLFAIDGATFYLQAFDRRQVLQPGRTLLFRQGVFNQLEEAGLTLGARLTALHEDGRLIFRSEAVTRRIFSLDTHFAVATDDGVRQFLTHPSLVGGSMELVDYHVRRNVMRILASGVLEEYSPEDMISDAGEYGLELEAQGDRLVLPDTKKELKLLLSYLNQNFVVCSLTNLRYETNSKRQLGS